MTMSYLGAIRVVPMYNVMGVAKAALESSVRTSLRIWEAAISASTRFRGSGEDGFALARSRIFRWC